MTSDNDWRDNIKDHFVLQIILIWDDASGEIA